MPQPVTNKLTRKRRSSSSEGGRRQPSLSSLRTQTWSFSHDPQHELQHDDDQPQSRPPTMAESVFSPEPTTTPATSTMLQQLAIQEWTMDQALLLEQSSSLGQSTMSLPSSTQIPAPTPAPVAAAASTSIWRVTPPFLLGLENFDYWMDSITLIAKCNGWDEHLKSRYNDEGADPSIQAAVNLLLYTTVSWEIAQDLKAKGWTCKLTPMQTLVMITSVLTEEKDGEDELPVKQAIKRLDPCNFPSLFAFLRRLRFLLHRYTGNRYAIWEVVLATIKTAYPPWYDKWEKVRRRHGFIQWTEFKQFLLRQAVYERMGRDVTEE